MDNNDNDQKIFSTTYPIVRIDKDSLKKAIKEKKIDLIKSALEQIPNFIQGATSLLETIKELSTSNDNSQKQYIDSCNLLIESLRTEIGKDISQETKNKYINDIKEILEKISQKDTENKNFLKDMAKIGGTVILIGISLFLGKNYLDNHPL